MNIINLIAQKELKHNITLIRSKNHIYFSNNIMNVDNLIINYTKRTVSLKYLKIYLDTDLKINFIELSK